MASTVEAKPPQQYVEFDEYIDFQVQKTRASIRLTDILTAIAGIATFVVGYLIVFSVLDHWVIEGGFSPSARGLMFAAVVCISAGWLAWKAIVPALRTVSRLFAAREIERSTPQLKSNLLNLIDLQGAGREVPQSIQSAMEKRAAVVLSQVNVDHVVDRSMLMRLSYALLAAVIVLCVYTLVSPKQISLARALVPFSSENVATQTEIFDVKPGDAEVLVRTQLEVTADLRGEVPESVQILFTTADRRYVDEPVQMHPIEDEQKRYRGTIIGENGRGILQDLSYKVVAGDAVTQDFQVTVLQPPSADIKEIRYDYPEYTQLESRTRPSGHISALEGTKITLTATASTPVKSAGIEFADERGTSFAAENVPMTITSGTQLRAEFTLKIVDKIAPQFYRIRVVGRNGASDPNPLRYNIVVRPDLPPEVALVDPTRDLEMPGNAVVPLLARAQDPDFAVKEVRLRIEKAGEIINRGDPPLFDGNKRSVVLKHDLKLSPLALQTGDVITYWMEARDNKAPYANAADSQRLNIRIGARAPNEQLAEQLKADHERQEEKRKEVEQERDKQAADKENNAGENATNEKQEPQPPQEQQPQPGANGEQAAAPKSETDKGGNSENPKPAQQGKDAPKPSGAEGAPKPEEGAKPANATEKQTEASDPSSAEDDEKVLEKVLKKYSDKANKKDDQSENPDNNGKQEPGADKPQPPDSPEQEAAGNDKHKQQDPKQQPRKNKPQSGGANEDPNKQQDKNGRTPDSNEPDSDAGKDPEKRKATDKGAADKTPDDPASKEKGHDPGDDLKKRDASDEGHRPDLKDAENNEKKDAEKEGNERPKPDPKDEAADPDSNTKSEQGGGKGETSKGNEGATEKNEASKSESPGEKTDPAGPAPDDDATSKGETKSGESTETKQQPAEDSPDARPEKARGDETGTGTPDKDPKVEPTPSKGDVKREDDADPGATQPGKQENGKKNPDVKSPSKNKPDEAKSSQKSAEKNQDSEKAGNPKTNPKQQQRDGTGKQSDKESPDKQAAQPPANSKSSESAKNSSDQPPPNNDSNQSPPGTPGEESKGTPKPGDASKSPPSKGGEKANERGQEAKGKSPTGEPGKEGSSESKEGAGQGESKKGGDKQGGSGGSSSQGGPAGKPGQKGGGGAQGGDQPKGGGGDGPGKAAGAGDQGTGNEGSAPGNPASEEGNLESARKATDLVLKQLQRELQRGEVDKDWLKKNGWSEEALQKFAERLQRQLEAPVVDKSPQAQARQRQFEEMLKNLNITPKVDKREGSRQFDRESEGVGPRRIDAPPEYREWFEAYVQEMLKRQKTSQPEKK